MESQVKNRPVRTLSSGWEARLGLNGRVYYYSHHSQTVQILPPPESWSCLFDLSYGWEVAVDYADKPYFINHVMQQVTYDDPRSDENLTNGDTDSCSTSSEQEHPVARKYEVCRHEKYGFGFIAGSERPVIIRTVSPGGPSENMLLPGDQIIKIGEENVKDAPRERVISLIRESTDSVTMTVLQPCRVASSSFLKPGKKLMKGMNRPRVRFADDNTVNGEEKTAGSSPLLIVPGVLRVLLEEGQSRSFQFNPDTTAGDIVSALCEKLDIKDSKLYSLVLIPPKRKAQSVREIFESKITDEILIAPWDCIAKTLSNPSVKHHECRFRLTFVAKDIHKLSREDPNSFKYHYNQCVNDVVSGDVYSDDLSTDDLLRLASLQMLELSLAQSTVDSSSTPGDRSGRKLSKKRSFLAPSKITLKQIEKDYGLAKFLPPSAVSLVSANHSKEHRKTLQQYLKANFASYVLGGGVGAQKSSSSSSPPSSPSTQNGVGSDSLLLRLRMQYVKLLSPHHLYGGRYFEATILAVIESDITLIVGYHYGISQLINSKTKMASIFADFSLIQSAEVAPYAPDASRTNVRVEFKDMAPLVLSMEPQSAQNFAFMIAGYCRVHDNNDMMLTLPIADSNGAPEYFGSHKVKASYWNYPPDGDSEPSSSHYCDFSEPISSSLLSDQIPESIRAMFQQSKIVDEKDRNSSSGSEIGENPDVSETSPEQSPRMEQNSLHADDEGVAMTTTDLSPKSSVSSVASASPSSGIGSVTSQTENPAEQILTTDLKHPMKSEDGESEWNELMVALYTDGEIGPAQQEEPDIIPPSEFKDLDEIVDDAVSDSDGSDVVEMPTSSASTIKEVDIQVSMPDAYADATDANASNEQREGENLDEFAEVEAVSANEEQSLSDKNEDGMTEKPETVTNEDKEVNPENSFVSPSAIQRKRFSSFKPGEVAEDQVDASAQASSSHFHDTEITDAGNAITSDQFKAKLGSKSLTLDIAPAQLEGEPEEFVTSPLPVSDLARGHKSLKSDKRRRNRFSWFGGNSMSRSLSLDKGLSKSGEKKKSRSFFRGFFSPSRSYSVGQEKGTSLFSLDSGSSMPESGDSSGRWKFGSIFRSPPSQSPKKSRFSFFKSFNRKKGSHTLVSSGDISSPVISEPVSSGVYAVFNAPEDKNNEKSEGQDELQRSSSVEDVRMRAREKISPKQRPVSFMTFQQLPMEFKRSPSQQTKVNSKVNVSKSPSQIRPPNLPLTSPINRSFAEESDFSNSEDESHSQQKAVRKATSLPQSPKTPDLAEYGDRKLDNTSPTKTAAPRKPARHHKKSSTNSQITMEDAHASVTVHQDATCSDAPDDADVFVHEEATEEDVSCVEEVADADEDGEDSCKVEDVKPPSQPRAKRRAPPPPTMALAIEMKDNHSGEKVQTLDDSNTAGEDRELVNEQSLSPPDKADQVEVVVHEGPTDEAEKPTRGFYDDLDDEEVSSEESSTDEDSTTEDVMNENGNTESSFIESKEEAVATVFLEVEECDVSNKEKEDVFIPKSDIKEYAMQEEIVSENNVQPDVHLDEEQTTDVVVREIGSGDVIGDLSEVESLHDSATDQSDDDEEDTLVDEIFAHLKSGKASQESDEITATTDTMDTQIADRNVDAKTNDAHLRQVDVGDTQISHAPSSYDSGNEDLIESDRVESEHENEVVVDEQSVTVSSRLNHLLLNGPLDDNRSAVDVSGLDVVPPGVITQHRDELSVVTDERTGNGGVMRQIPDDVIPGDNMVISDREIDDNDNVVESQLSPVNEGCSKVEGFDADVKSGAESPEKADVAAMPDLTSIEPYSVSADRALDLLDFPPPPEEYNVPLPSSETAVTFPVPENAGGETEKLEQSRPADDTRNPGADCETAEPVNVSHAEARDENSLSDKENASVLTRSAPQIDVVSPGRPSPVAPTSEILQSPTQYSYHSLIAPPVFGQKREIRSFQSIKPPTTSHRSKPLTNGNGLLTNSNNENKLTNRRGPATNPTQVAPDTVRGRVISHVAYPLTSSRPGKPPLPPKPVIT